MRSSINKNILHLLFPFLCFFPLALFSQTTQVTEAEIDVKDTFQTVVGFGASLAYYESWLIAHPNKSQIYKAIFSELSLDILRVRNAYAYDSEMVKRVREFKNNAHYYLGKPISILSTSWGPPAFLKSNGDRKNGGTLRYSVEQGKVEFDYSGFADWWDESLSDYALNEIYPDYISIQNEPEFTASWESCLLKPSETVNAGDTIAGYNKALDAVFEKVEQRENRPSILGPENVGIGYNAVENYINALDVSKLDGIAHHLYHGVDENNPFLTDKMTKVGKLHPEIPHIQTEFSRGDWYALGGLIYKSFYDENVVAYLYWDLIWDGNGLVSLDFPWDKNRWKDRQKGYTKTKEFYAFKQFSAFVHPGWKRIGVEVENSDAKALAFISQSRDSVSFVVVNKSETGEINLKLNMPGYWIDEAEVFITSEHQNCESMGGLIDRSFTIPPHSIATVNMRVSKVSTFADRDQARTIQNSIVCKSNYPNPFSHSTTMEFLLAMSQNVQLTVYDNQGRTLIKRDLGIYETGRNQFTLQRKQLDQGLYFYKISNSLGDAGRGRFMVLD